MRRYLIQTTLHFPLKQMPTARFFFLVACTSFVISLIWIQLVTQPEQQVLSESLIQEALENVAKDYRYSEVYRKTSRLPKELKYMLFWTESDFAPFNNFGEGQKAFIKNNCSVINCYVTNNKRFFKGDITKFDAIAFNGRTMNYKSLPYRRSPRQKYIYFNTESAEYYPVCHKVFDDYFNWTSTYRLDSDIPYPYVRVKNSRGEVVGPKTSVEWIDDLPEVDESLSKKIANKTKAAAWFVSHCSSKSGRKELVRKLQKALVPYGYNVDIYGSCGPLKCPRDKTDFCNSMLEKNYFFYMSLENSFAEDYVTEKLLTALQHDTVPIVYGGADYDRFLPPGSYLDAKKFNVFDLAAIMDRFMQSPKIYSQFFRWRNQYVYSDPTSTENVCDLCAALNNKEMFDKVTVYKDFRNWWNPNYKNRC